MGSNQFFSSSDSNRAYVFVAMAQPSDVARLPRLGQHPRRVCFDLVCFEEPAERKAKLSQVALDWTRGKPKFITTLGLLANICWISLSSLLLVLLLKGARHGSGRANLQLNQPPSRQSFYLILSPPLLPAQLQPEWSILLLN